MAKNIIKEIIMILLLSIAIILVLGVLLYEYVPANKIIPEKVSYTTPENVKSELETEINDGEEELYVDYHIDSTQINNYKKIQEYVPGRKNPFATLDSTESVEGTVDSTNSNNNSSNTENSTNSTKQEDTGYLPNKGTK